MFVQIVSVVNNSSFSMEKFGNLVNQSSQKLCHDFIKC